MKTLPTEAGAGLDQEIVELYDSHSPGLVRYAASLVRGVDAAHDAVQEAFLRYFVERSHGRVIDNPRAWLYQVLRNYVFDRLSAGAVTREVALGDIDLVADLQHDPENLARRAQMAREIAASLTDREFECLRLRTEGLSYAEIADVLDIRSGTVGALLAHAHKKIRPAGGNRKAACLETAEALHSLFFGGTQPFIPT